MFADFFNFCCCFGIVGSLILHLVKEQIQIETSYLQLRR